MMKRYAYFVIWNQLLKKRIHKCYGRSICIKNINNGILEEDDSLFDGLSE